MRIHWLWLAHRSGVSDRMKSALLQHFHDAEDIYFADAERYAQVAGMTEKAIEGLQDKDLTAARRILDACEQEDLQILTIQDAAYPKRLKNIDDPPVVLYYKGRLPDFDENPLIAVVGTRKASPYGLTAAKRLGYQIAKCGGTVVSGMASGIDSVAMQGALTAGGTVIGVLGCGADQVYPASNRALFADTERYGCILSEFPPGTPPNGWNFPKRNRIISGLSCGVLVVEAPEKSGALITARQALDQGRDVFVVPGNIDVDTFVGSNRLLRDGAILASSGWDVLSEYQHLFPGKIRKDTGRSTQLGYADEAEEAAPQMLKVAQKPRIPAAGAGKKDKNDKKVIDKRTNPPYSDVNEPRIKLSADEQRLVDAIGGESRLVDDVIAETGLGTAKVLAMLTLLEVRGVVKRLPGRYISLK